VDREIQRLVTPRGWVRWQFAQPICIARGALLPLNDAPSPSDFPQETRKRRHGMQSQKNYVSELIRVSWALIALRLNQKQVIFNEKNSAMILNRATIGGAMHQILQELRDLLESIVQQIMSTITTDDPAGLVHNNWSFPNLTRSELSDMAQSIVEEIDESDAEDLGERENLLSDYRRRLQYLRKNTLPNLWNNANQGISAYIITLNGLRCALKPVLNASTTADAATRLRRLTARLRGMESKLDGLEPRTETLSKMIGRIEDAYNAADQLPADLESLSEARQQIENIIRAANADHAKIVNARDEATSIDARLRECSKHAEAALGRCETAYAAATSVGLAAAFSERSKGLSWSLALWVAGLIVALAAGSYLGSLQLHSLSGLLNAPSASPSLVTINIMLAALSVGAPVWFSWLATKQIGQRFRLAEDYAYKASISRAYEGFRREAARVDVNMEARLLESALDRLDELPLRLVEAETHGSPWHELVSLPVVKDAVKSVPGFVDQVRQLANDSLDRLSLLRRAGSSGKENGD
jgi:hypothetical protein